MVAAWPLTGRREQLELLGSWYVDGAVSGAVITGPPGVGKTRLAEEVLRLAAAADRPCARAVGHPATQPIPLGALAHLLPADLVPGIGVGEEERATLFHAARAGLAKRADGQRLVLAVDDVDQLDRTSLALLLPLVAERVVFLVATLRSGRETPAPLATLLKDGHLERLELGPLDDEQISVLIHRVLDGPLDTQGLARLTALSGGNLQMLTELIRGALARHALVRDGSVWRLGELPTTSGLQELVAEHLAGTDENGRRALEVLAVAGRFGLADLEEWFERGVLEDLEDGGLVHVTTSGRRTEVALAHPLYGEVLRSQLPVLRTRSIQRQLADRLDAHGIRRREDLVRVALWRLDGGGEVETQLLLPAARLALAGRDTALAVRLADSARAEGAAGEVAIVLVEAHAMAGRSAAVEEAVDAVWDSPELTDAQRAHLTRRLADVRLTALRDADGALDANARGLQRVDRPGRAGLPARPSGVDAWDRAPDRWRPWRLRPRFPRRAQLASVSSWRPHVRTRCSHSDAAPRRCRSARRPGRAERAPEWLARRGLAQHLVNEAHALAYVGYYRDAAAVMEPAAERARQSGATARARSGSRSCSARSSATAAGGCRACATSRRRRPSPSELGRVRRWSGRSSAWSKDICSEARTTPPRTRCVGPTRSATARLAPRRTPASRHCVARGEHEVTWWRRVGGSSRSPIASPRTACWSSKRPCATTWSVSVTPPRLPTASRSWQASSRARS